MQYESNLFDRNSDFPSQLEAIIDAPDNGGDSFVVREAIKHLKGLLQNPPKRSTEARLLYLDYVDGFFEECLLDFDKYPGLWKENACEVEGLIEQAEDEISKPFYSTTCERPPVRATLGPLRERMIAYHAINDAFLGKFDEFKFRVRKADRISQANVQSLIEEGENHCSPEGWRFKVEFACRPLLTISRAGLEGRYAHLLAEPLSAYQAYLQQSDCSVDDCGSAFQKLDGLNSATEEGGSDDASATESAAPSCFLPPWGAPRVREYVIFGREPGHGEPLKWIVLDIAEGKTLLLSDKILDVHTYAAEDTEACLWEDSDLREFINGELVFDLFSSAERAYIDGAPRIMKALEMERWFPRDEDRIAYGTAHANSHGLKLDASGAGGYWTSTPGERPCCLAFVRPDGDINTQGFPQDDDIGLGVRLAVTLKVDAHTYSRHHEFSDDDEIWDDAWLEDGLDVWGDLPLAGEPHPLLLPSSAETAVLKALSDSGEAGVSDLAGHLEFPVSKTYNALAKLEEKGLVEKTVSKRRLLTPAGTKALRTLGCNRD